MLLDVLHTVAKLQTSLQGTEVDFASMPVMVKSTAERLRELEKFPDSSTWFKVHMSGFFCFTDPAQLGKNISE